MKRHGHTKGCKESPTYISWHNMVNRCKRPYKQAADYIDRGIAVCERWLLFRNFLEDMGERPHGMTLDRKDNDGGYCKDNCRWATKHEQSRNRRDNRVIEHNGKSMCVTDWAASIGINESSLRNRIDKLGWSVERAVTTARTK